jgi:hypothetical protein
MKSDTVVIPPANAAAEPLVRSSALPFGLRDDGFQVQMRMRINDAGQQQHAEGIDLARAWRGHKLWTDLQS